MNKDPYSGLPWKDIDEYHKLAMEYKLFGGNLKKHLEKLYREEKRKRR